MEFFKSVIVLVVLFVNSDAGGHEEGHDHVKVHVPEFIHHDHHTKVITIHHHHHKPKKEHHHHHHHHHHKPSIPHIPKPYHHSQHRLKTTTRTVSKGHTHLGQKSLKPKRLGPKNHGHYGHHDSKSYESPSVNYESPTVNYAPPVNYGVSPSLGNNYGSFLPSVSNLPSSPQIHGISHTVKQVKVFDSLPGALPGVTGNTGVRETKGYEVTEQGNEDEEDDVFTSVNSLSKSYPGTYNFVQNAAAEHGIEAFSDISQLASTQAQNNNPFTRVQPQQSYSNLEDFSIQNYSPSASSLPNIQPSQFAEAVGFDIPADPIVGNDIGSTLLSYDEGGHDDTPVVFSREAGLQHAINTGGIETVVY